MNVNDDKTNDTNSRPEFIYINPIPLAPFSGVRLNVGNSETSRLEFDSLRKTCVITRHGKQMEFTNVEILDITREMSAPGASPKPFRIQFTCDIGKIDTDVEVVCGFQVSL